MISDRDLLSCGTRVVTKCSNQTSHEQRRRSGTGCIAVAIDGRESTVYPKDEIYYYVLHDDGTVARYMADEVSA